MRKLMLRVAVTAFAALCGSASALEPALDPAALPRIALPPIGLQAQDIAVVINDADPASVETGARYASQRGIAPERVIHVSFPAGQAVMSEDDFLRVEELLRFKVPSNVQAYALAWTLPYRVDCMSVTTAFALGYDRAYCATGCQLTKPSPYYDSHSNAPFTDHGLRPAMLLAGRDVAEVKALIDRGLRSDNRWPAGTAYLVSTGDRKRNVRAETYERIVRQQIGGYPLSRVDDAAEDKPDVMFLFTGAQHVEGVRSNRYLDGAAADHLTSLGGMLTDSPQTSALEWLSAGATGSYGNTSEPCNYRAKFPDIPVMLGRYLGGETLVEAYWKSVLMPGQGVFIGDPLARPFGGVRQSLRSAQQRVVQTRLLRPGSYLLQGSASNVGPFRTVGRLQVKHVGSYDLGLPAGIDAFYRVVPVPAR